jgi:two-component system response regulator GlrR
VLRFDGRHASGGALKNTNKLTRCQMAGVRYALWAADRNGALAARVTATLQRLESDDIRLAANDDASDAVLLVLAEPASLALAAAHVATARARAPMQRILVIAFELDRAQIHALLGAGVLDFVAAPFADDELALRLQRLAEQAPVRAPELPPCAHPRIRDFVGSSAAFMRQVAKLPTFAGCNAGVLILGETGTGKEVCAQAIHYLSARASKPWVAVNCGAIPTELIENELFGHVKGAYTTAHVARTGLVREAEGGTLFLDDIDCLPLAAQTKLLRFLQEGEYRPVGSNGVQRADVRVISASNHKLSDLVARGAFRQDLYFRLNVLTLELPPLRERRDDIAALALHFLRRFAAQFQRPVTGLAPRALQKLLLHDWPGNVRELKHVIERAVLLAAGPTLAAEDIDLGGHPDASADADSFRVAKARVIEHFERSFIEHLLAAHGGNVTHAAQAARKNRRAFFELMRKYRIEPGRFREVGR